MLHRLLLTLAGRVGFAFGLTLHGLRMRIASLGPGGTRNLACRLRLRLGSVLTRPGERMAVSALARARSGLALAAGTGHRGNRRHR